MRILANRFSIDFPYGSTICLHCRSTKWQSLHKQSSQAAWSAQQASHDEKGVRRKVGKGAVLLASLCLYIEYIKWGGSRAEFVCFSWLKTRHSGSQIIFSSQATKRRVFSLLFQLTTNDIHRCVCVQVTVYGVAVASSLQPELNIHTYTHTNTHTRTPTNTPRPRPTHKYSHYGIQIVIIWCFSHFPVTISTNVPQSWQTISLSCLQLCW